jgi:Cu(I)/Ag(I) efflux system membrane fusion protein
MKVGPVLVVLLGVAAGLGGGVALERTHLLEQLDVFEGLAAQPAQVIRVGPKILYWWDPMIPDFKSDKPGKSPMGMDMVPVYEGQEPGGGKQERAS